MVKLFLAGMLSRSGFIALQRGIELWLGTHPLLFSFGLSAGVEELLKWSVLYFIIFNHTEFDEPYDGIVYAASVP